MPNGQTDTTTYNDSAFVSLVGIQYPTINLGLDTVICPRDPITLNAGGSRDSVLWSTLETTNSISVDSAGMFSVVVYKNGCASEDSILVSLYPASATWCCYPGWPII